MNNKIITLAYELCRIPSITGNEAEVMEFLECWLNRHGLICERIPVSQGRFNVFAYFEKHSQYSVIYCTHLDTVGPFIEPRLDEQQGVLQGRGSCDAKGIASAMIHAAIAENEAGNKDVALLFTVGEEDASDGAKACVPMLKDRARFLVVGEPTELKAASAQKGCLVFDLVAQGKEAHSSQPELGDSAIHKLVAVMHRLIDYPWTSDTRFGKTLINFGEISGGPMRNIVASYAAARSIMRTSTNNAAIKSIIERNLIDGVTCHVKSSADPFEYFVPVGFPDFLAGFGSDAPYLREVGRPILIGPGSLSLAHRPDEHVSFSQLHKGFEVYRQIARQLRTRDGN